MADPIELFELGGLGGLGGRRCSLFSWRSRDKTIKCDTKSLVEVVPTIKEGTARVTGRI